MTEPVPASRRLVLPLALLAVGVAFVAGRLSAPTPPPPVPIDLVEPVTVARAEPPHHELLQLVPYAITREGRTVRFRDHPPAEARWLVTFRDEAGQWVTVACELVRSEGRAAK